jgi:SAM-dependent methyltransferase
MPYRYATSRLNYSDLASGQVFYSLPGHPAFPIRLAREIFLRCQAHRKDREQPVSLYDPCCGAAYALGILAYFHREQIGRITASDVDPRAVEKARQNLDLLSGTGIDRRREEIAGLRDRYGKASHQVILESATHMADLIHYQEETRPLPVRVFLADATDPGSLRQGLDNLPIDMLFTDIPYGLHSHWQGAKTEDPLGTMLEALREFLNAESILAIAADKTNKFNFRHYRRLERFQIGKRQIVFLKLN